MVEHINEKQFTFLCFLSTVIARRADSILIGGWHLNQ